jgi:hypothetical protein
MVDLFKLVTAYYYSPHTKGNNSIKAILPAIISESDFLQEKYSKKDIYGRGLEIHSLNFNKLKTWVEYNDNGKVFCVHI